VIRNVEKGSLLSLSIFNGQRILGTKDLVGSYLGIKKNGYSETNDIRLRRTANSLTPSITTIPSPTTIPSAAAVSSLAAVSSAAAASSVAAVSSVAAGFDSKDVSGGGVTSGVKHVERLLEARLFQGCLLAPCEGKASVVYEFEKPNSKVPKRFLSVIHPSSKVMKVRIDEDLEVNFKNGEYVHLAQSLSYGDLNSHDLLSTLYKYYRFILSDTFREACKKSFAQVRLYLVQEVRGVYASQSVSLSNKHLEILVRPLTLKVCIISSGDTLLLPGEVISTVDALAIEKSVKSSGQQPPFYKPILLGLTKASLNSDSFIAAASFQETTRILMEAAIQGRKDWLFGLKENVIVGRLLPIGTGCTPVSFITSVNKNVGYHFSVSNIRDYILLSRKS
jgi:hypothetical protein